MATVQQGSNPKTLIQFHTWLVALAAVLVGVIVIKTPRPYFEQAHAGFPGVYSCGRSNGLGALENQRIKIDADFRMSMVGAHLEIPIGTLTQVPGNSKLATLDLAKGWRDPDSGFSPDVRLEVEGHGRYIYLRGVRDGREIYGISCAN